MGHQTKKIIKQRITEDNGIVRTITDIINIWEKKYDDLGNLVEYIDKKSSVTYNYTYDELGNVVTVIESGGANTSGSRNQAAAKHILFRNGYVNAVGPERSGGEGFFGIIILQEIIRDIKLFIFGITNKGEL